MPVEAQHFSFKTAPLPSSRARVGTITTSHGDILTPAFVPVGTHGALKGVLATNSPLIFCNTYHLIVHPGTAVIAEMGGIHRWMHRSQPIITDSGGFQLFSLSQQPGDELKKNRSHNEHSVVKVTEEGAWFRSYRDGNLIFLSPEGSVEAQKQIGADIILPLDELLSHYVSPQRLQESFDRTHRWQQRSLEAHQKKPSGQAMYGIIHGGTNLDLRKRSAEFLGELPFDGFAIGGSLGRCKEDVVSIVEHTKHFLPPEAPIHLLGIGDLDTIQACIPLGVDTFDSCYPTRAARHGQLLTHEGTIKIGNTRYRVDPRPLCPQCACESCVQHYSRSYLHHLFKTKEVNYTTLSTQHNLQFMIKWMGEQRTFLLQQTT